MPDPQSTTSEPSARRLGRAGTAVIAIFVAMIVVFFAGRLIWHDERQEADPASLAAPDMSNAASETQPQPAN